MSNVEDEKSLVAQLRNEKGMTLQEIANKLGKSIYWVNSRLDKKYQPKRDRKTGSSTDDLANDSHEIFDPKLSREIEIVKKYREEGLTYEEIASKLNRSIYWVHTRLRKKYAPRVTLNEKQFQESRVIPWLENRGHKIIGQYVRSEAAFFIQEADILSFFEGKLYISEVKVSITHHQFQTAIGQLLLHSFAFKDERNICLQIVLPSEVKSEKFEDELLNFFSDLHGIEIIFVPEIYHDSITEA